MQPLYSQLKTFELQRRISRHQRFASLRPTTRLVWFDLWHYQAMGDDGTIWPARSTLAENLHVDVRSIQRALDELRECGLIHQVGVHGPPGRETNVYILLLPEWLEPVQIGPPTGDHLVTPPGTTWSPHQGPPGHPTRDQVVLQEDLGIGSNEWINQPEDRPEDGTSGAGLVGPKTDQKTEEQKPESPPRHAEHMAALQAAGCVRAPQLLANYRQKPGFALSYLVPTVLAIAHENDLGPGWIMEAVKDPIANGIPKDPSIRDQERFLSQKCQRLIENQNCAPLKSAEWFELDEKIKRTWIELNDWRDAHGIRN